MFNKIFIDSVKFDDIRIGTIKLFTQDVKNKGKKCIVKNRINNWRNLANQGE